MERLFESLLWNNCFIVLTAVVVSMLTALAMFFIASVDVYYLISHLEEYLSPAMLGESKSDFRAATITHLVEVIDGYLLATVLLILLWMSCLSAKLIKPSRVKTQKCWQYIVRLA